MTSFPSRPQYPKGSTSKEFFGPSVVKFSIDDNIRNWPLSRELRKGFARDALHDGLKELAKLGVKFVKEQMWPGHGYKTGYYYSKISVRRNTRNVLRTTVWDRGVYYGPWLEKGNKLGTLAAARRKFEVINSLRMHKRNLHHYFKHVWHLT